MTHLDDVQFVDAVDGVLPPALAEHLAACAACGARVAELRAALAAMQDDEQPEPSPLFWTHFAARVQAAIDVAPQPGARFAPRWAWRGLLAGAAAAAVLAAWLGGPARPERAPERPVPVALNAPAPSAPEQPIEAEDIDADDAWALVRSVAAEFDYDTAERAGAAPAHGTLDRAALELTGAERAELARLIEAELKRTGP